LRRLNVRQSSHRTTQLQMSVCSKSLRCTISPAFTLKFNLHFALNTDVPVALPFCICWMRCRVEEIHDRTQVVQTVQPIHDEKTVGTDKQVVDHGTEVKEFGTAGIDAATRNMLDAKRADIAKGATSTHDESTTSVSARAPVNVVERTNVFEVSSKNLNSTATSASIAQTRAELVSCSVTHCAYTENRA
jgi:hypothetical protein